ncbi:MAG: recombinase family protein [Pseudonocardiaceae bacterium]
MAPARTPHTRHASGPIRALGYLRVSTEGQAESGAGLDAQRAAIEAEASRQGWQLEVITDTSSGAHLNRPALAAALDRLDRGDADLLLAAKLDRVSRSVKDFTELLERAHREGWRLVLLDLGDTSTATGELTANMIASAAQYERRLIGQRTREGLAAKRAAGVRLGRPSVLPPEVVARIVGERAEGRAMRVIAEGLTADGVPTARGGAEWKVSSVQAVLKSQDAAALAGQRNGAAAPRPLP